MSNKNEEKPSDKMETATAASAPSPLPICTIDVLKPFEKHRNQSYRNKTSAEIIKETKNLLAGGKFKILLPFFYPQKKNQIFSLMNFRFN